jgi:hypothetical protein
MFEVGLSYCGSVRRLSVAQSGTESSMCVSDRLIYSHSPFACILVSKPAAPLILQSKA